MRIDSSLPAWVLLSGLGVAVGWSLHCQTPTSHVSIQMGDDCKSCHENDFQNAQQPLHVGELSRECGDCHANTTWVPARGSSHSWPLDGAHALAGCSTCHGEAPAVYEGTATDCVSCHREQSDAVLEPSHADFSDDCASCHQTSAWQPAAFQHSWPLDGAHASATCASCHGEAPPVYEGTPTDCVGCHAEQRDAVVEPPHTNFADDCASCHQTAAWQPARFEHSWPLEGAHASATCASCHGESPRVYEGTATDCVGCHAQDRDAVVEPSHVGFAEDCASCHQTSAWQPAAFQHSWPLEGAHAAASCASCHGSPPTYQGTPATCSSCHADDRASVVSPPHDAFSDDCSSCHGTASWDAAAFVHTTQFPLLGAHRAVECSACHTGSPAVFAGTASECVACHQQDYDQSPFPGHSTFATTCQDCHLSSGWVPASGGNHPQNRFSITGRHNYPCNDCHNPSLGPNGAGNADCVGCHEGEHTLARMDNEHVGEVRNYPTGANRAPNFCLQCHPGGNE